MRTPRRHEADVRDYVEAERAERVGDHQIDADTVAGTIVPRSAAPRSRSVRITRAPAAQGVIADLLTLIQAEARTLRDAQVSNGKLEPEQVQTVHKLTDAATKLLREERRQLDLDDYSRLSGEEILEHLPPEVAEAARALLLPEPMTTPAPRESDEDEEDDSE